MRSNFFRTVCAVPTYTCSASPPGAIPASLPLSQSGKPAGLGDSTTQLPGAPPPLPPKHQRHTLTPQSTPSDEQGSDISTHLAERPLYKSRYSASEPGHGEATSTLSSSRIGKPLPLQPSVHRSYAAIHGTREGHPSSLRMSNANVVYPRRPFSGTSGDSSANSTPYSATMTFPSVLPDEDGIYPSPLHSSLPSGGASSQSSKKLKKPPPSGYRSPTERMARHRAIAMTSRPHSLMHTDTVIDLTDHPLTPFPSSSTENALYFAQSHSQVGTIPLRPVITDQTHLHRRSTTVKTSSTSGSGSGDDSTFSASSMYASTVPTSPSASAASDGAHKSNTYSSHDDSRPQDYSSPTNFPHSSRSQDRPYRSPPSSLDQHTQPHHSFVYPSSQARPAPQKPHYIPDYPPPPPPPPKSSNSPTASRKLTKKRPTSKLISSVPPPSRSAREARMLESAQREQTQTYTRTIFGVKFTVSSPSKEKKGWLGRNGSRERSRSRSQSRERRNSTEKRRRKSSKGSLSTDGKVGASVFNFFDIDFIPVLPPPRLKHIRPRLTNLPELRQLHTFLHTSSHPQLHP